jgi:hypothetical protein
MERESLWPCQRRLVHQFRDAVVGATRNGESSAWRLDKDVSSCPVACISARWTSLLAANLATVSIKTLVVVFPRTVVDAERAMHGSALRDCAKLVGAGCIKETLVLSCMDVQNRELSVGDAQAPQKAALDLYIVGGALGEGAWNIVRFLRPATLRLSNEIDAPLRIKGFNECRVGLPSQLDGLDGCSKLVVDGGPLRLGSDTTWALIRAAGPSLAHLELRDCDIEPDTDQDDGEEKTLPCLIPKGVTHLGVDNVDPPWHSLQFEHARGLLQLAVFTTNEAHDDMWDPARLSGHLQRLSGLKRLVIAPHEANGARPVSLATLAAARNACISIVRLDCEFRVRTDLVATTFNTNGTFNVSLVADAQFHLTTALNALSATDMLVYVRHADTKIDADMAALGKWTEDRAAAGDRTPLKFLASGAGERAAIDGRIPADCIRRIPAAGLSARSTCGVCGSNILSDMRSARYCIGCSGGHFACTACVHRLIEHVRADQKHADGAAEVPFDVTCKRCIPHAERSIVCASPHGPTGRGIPAGFVGVRRVPGYRRPVLVAANAFSAPSPVWINRLLGAHSHGLAARILPIDFSHGPIELLPGSRDSRVAILYAKQKDGTAEWAVLSVTNPLCGDGAVVVRYIETHRNRQTALPSPTFTSIVAHRVAHLFPDQPQTWTRAPIIHTRLRRTGRGSPAADFGAALVAALYECQTRYVPYEVARHPLDTNVLVESELESALETALASPAPPRDLGLWVNSLLHHDAELKSDAVPLVVSAHDDLYSTLPPEYARIPPELVLDPVTAYTPQTLHASHFFARANQSEAKPACLALAAVTYFAAGFVAPTAYTSRVSTGGADPEIDASRAFQTLVASVRMNGSATDEKTQTFGQQKYPLRYETLEKATRGLPNTLEALLPACLDLLVRANVEHAQDQVSANIFCREQQPNHTTSAGRTGADAHTMCHTIDLVPDTLVTDPSNALAILVDGELKNRLHASDRVTVTYSNAARQRVRVYHVRRYATKDGFPVLLSDAPVRVDQAVDHHVLAAVLVVTGAEPHAYVLCTDRLYHAWNAKGATSGEGKSFSELRGLFQTRGVAFAYANSAHEPSAALYVDAS